MPTFGVRKRFRHDPEAQALVLEKLKQEHEKELDRIDFRRSVAWYKADVDKWVELQIKQNNDNSLYVVANVYNDIPTRKIWEKQITRKQDGRTFIPENGCVLDGLEHCVWIRGYSPKYDDKSHRIVKLMSGESQAKLYQGYCRNEGHAQEAILALYDIKISYPEIQHATTVWMREHGGKADNDRNLVKL